MPERGAPPLRPGSLVVRAPSRAIPGPPVSVTHAGCRIADSVSLRVKLPNIGVDDLSFKRFGGLDDTNGTVTV